MTDSPGTSSGEENHVQAAASLPQQLGSSVGLRGEVSLPRARLLLGHGAQSPHRARTAPHSDGARAGSQRLRRCSPATAELSQLLPQPGAPGGGSNPSESPSPPPLPIRPRGRAPAAPLAGRDAGLGPEPLSRPARSGAGRSRAGAPPQRLLSCLLLLLTSSFSPFSPSHLLTSPFSPLLLLLPSPFSSFSPLLLLPVSSFSSPFSLPLRCPPRGATAVPCRGDPWGPRSSHPILPLVSGRVRIPLVSSPGFQRGVSGVELAAQGAIL